MRVAAHLKRPTQGRRGPRHVSPYLVLLRVGFTVPRRVATRAVRSYRTISPLPALADLGGIISVARSVGPRPPGVTWHPALWSPDFPPYTRGIQRLSGRLRAQYNTRVSALWRSCYSSACNDTAISLTRLRRAPLTPAASATACLSVNSANNRRSSRCASAPNSSDGRASAPRTSTTISPFC